MWFGQFCKIAYNNPVGPRSMSRYEIQLDHRSETAMYLITVIAAQFVCCLGWLGALEDMKAMNFMQKKSCICIIRMT